MTAGHMCIYTCVHIQASIPCHAVSHFTSELGFQGQCQMQYLILKPIEINKFLYKFTQPLIILTVIKHTAIECTR